MSALTATYSHDSAETWMVPHIRCSNCGYTVSGIRTSAELVPMGTPTDTYLGLNGNQEAVATKKRPLVQRNIYRVGPCGCQVSNAWRDAYHDEVKRRRAGKVPQELALLTPQEMAKQVLILESRISKLMQDLELAKQEFGTGNRLATERELIMTVDQLLRLVPGAHNKLPAVEVSDWNKEWAKNNRYVLPPSPETAKAIPALSVLEQTMALHQQGLLSAETVAKAAGLNKTEIDEDMAIGILQKLQDAERSDLDYMITNLGLRLATAPNVDQLAFKYEAATAQYNKARQTYLASSDNVEAKRTYAAILQAYLLTLGLAASQIDYKKAGYTKQPVNPSQIAVKVTSDNINKFPLKVGQELHVGDTVYVGNLGGHLVGSWDSGFTAGTTKSYMTKTGAVSELQMLHPNPNTGLQTKPLGPPPLKTDAATQYMNKQAEAVDIEHGYTHSLDSSKGWQFPQTKTVPPLASKSATAKVANSGPEDVLISNPAGVSAAVIAANGASAKALAQRVYKNLISHQSNGEALTKETKDYLRSYEEITGAPHPFLSNNEVPIPSTKVPVGVSKQPVVIADPPAENLLDRLTSKNTRRLGRLKRKGPPKVEADAESDADDPEDE